MRGVRERGRVRKREGERLRGREKERDDGAKKEILTYKLSRQINISYTDILFRVRPDVA